MKNQRYCHGPSGAGFFKSIPSMAPRSKTLRTESATSSPPTKHANIAHTGAHGQLPLHFQNKKKEILFTHKYIGLLCYFR